MMSLTKYLEWKMTSTKMVSLKMEIRLNVALKRSLRDTMLTMLDT